MGGGSSGNASNLSCKGLDEVFDVSNAFCEKPSPLNWSFENGSRIIIERNQKHDHVDSAGFNIITLYLLEGEVLGRQIKVRCCCRRPGFDSSTLLTVWSGELPS